MATSMPSSTPKASTASAAAMISTRSRFMRHTANRGLGDRACQSALMTATASTGRGSQCSVDSANTITSTMATNATRPARLDTAPAAALAVVAENPAPTGMP